MLFRRVTCREEIMKREHKERNVSGEELMKASDGNRMYRGREIIRVRKNGKEAME